MRAGGAAPRAGGMGAAVCSRVLASLVAFLSVTAILVGPVPGPATASPVAGRPLPGAPAAAPPLATSMSTAREMGSYEWDDTAWWPDPSGYAGTLVHLQSLGVTILYVDITEGVTLLRDHSSALTSFESAFRQLVAEAGADGLGVDALGADPAWATTQKEGPAQLLTVVSQIEASGPSLHGVQFDVEPWALRT